MDLSIIILNYKARGLLKECLKGIEMVQPKLDYEIIVVDNASGDGTAAMMRENFPDINFISSEENLGYAKGNNLGIQKASGRYVMIMNPDIIVFSGVLEKLIQFLDERQDVGIVGPKLLNPDKSLQYSCYRFPDFWEPVYRRTPLGRFNFAKKKLDQYFMKDFDHNSAKEVDWLLGGCLLIRRKALEDVGFLDERYFAYFDDVDLCRSMWEKKWKVVYDPEISVIHFHRRESAEGNWWSAIFKKVTRIHLASWLKYFKKWGRKTTATER
ncbi:MAG: glycosyltransferase family 2 protein [Patescibacteria group bacterium]